MSAQMRGWLVLAVLILMTGGCATVIVAPYSLVMTLISLSLVLAAGVVVIGLIAEPDGAEPLEYANDPRRRLR